MSEFIIKNIRRSINEAQSRKGMVVGLTEIRIDASHAELLIGVINTLTAQLDAAKSELSSSQALLAEAKTASLAIRSERDQALSQLHSQLAERDAEIDHLRFQLSGESKAAVDYRAQWKVSAAENATLLTKLAERDKLIEEQQAEIKVKQRVLDEHYGVAAICNELVNENAALHAQVERLQTSVNNWIKAAGENQLQRNEMVDKVEEARKQAAAEILDSLTQEEIKRITSVGDPRVTTISSKLLAMMAELRQRYGLEG